MLLFRRALLILLLLCLGCSAQLNDPQVTKRIERQVRAYYSVPTGVDILVGKREPSEFPNYDKIVLTFASGEQKLRPCGEALAHQGSLLLQVLALDRLCRPGQVSD